MATSGFTPHVQRHEGNAGDEHTRKLNELFQAVAVAEKDHREAVRNTTSAEHEATVARERERAALARFTGARHELQEALDKKEAR